MTNTSSPDLDPRAQFWGKAAKGVLLILGLAVFAPVIWLALGGLVGLIVAGVIAGATWMLKEPAYTFAANMRLKLIKNEAAKNPVETLQEEHRKQTIVLNERKKGVETMAGAIKTLDQTIDAVAREFPDDPELPQMREDQAELEKLLASRESDWQAAYVTLGEFAREIHRVSRLWDVSLAAAKARAQSGLTEGEWLSKLKTQTAIDTVRTSLNTQLTALNSERMQAEADRILKGKAAARALPAKADPVVVVLAEGKSSTLKTA